VRAGSTTFGGSAGDRVKPFLISRAFPVSASHGGLALFVLPLGVTGCLVDWILSRGSRASFVMDSMTGLLARAEGAGSSSRGVRDGASESLGPGGFLGDPPHVEGRARVSTRVRGTASDGGAGGDGFLFPPSVETATRGRERVSPKVPGPLGGGGQEVPPQEQGQYDGRPRRARHAGLPHIPPQVSGVGVPQRALERDAFSAALRDSLDAFISLYMNGCLSCRQPLGPPDGQGAVVAD